MVIARRARFGQLMLFAALLFGIATMHTVGHPVPGHGGGAAPHLAGPADAIAPAADVAPAHPAARVAPADAAHPAAMTDPLNRAARTATVHPANAIADAAGPVATASTGQRHSADLPNAGPELPSMGMDPMTVCLAVLDTFTLILLAAWLLRTDPGALLAACHARILRALRPNPPPRKTLLARLSVLRI
ncbi:hypothetical protein [Streptomyces sp. NPDC005408]|uniref:hypothetical protein n=1 Tax=Streptomyces sp. NPDC005408 TaxID=3155341 RepID=UPI0033A45B3B